MVRFPVQWHLCKTLLSYNSSLAHWCETSCTSCALHERTLVKHKQMIWNDNICRYSILCPNHTANTKSINTQILRRPCKMHRNAIFRWHPMPTCRTWHAAPRCSCPKASHKASPRHVMTCLWSKLTPPATAKCMLTYWKPCTWPAMKTWPSGWQSQCQIAILKKQCSIYRPEVSQNSAPPIRE